MITFFKKKKNKFIILILIIFIFSYYFFLNNNCLNFNKLIKSYIGLGFANIQQCFLSNTKSIIKVKSPKLFSFFSDLNRHYFSKYDKDILDLDSVQNYEKEENELFKEVIENSKKGLKGIINNENFQEEIERGSFLKSYKYYSRQNKDNSNTKFYDKINLTKIDDDNKPKLSWKHVSLSPEADPSSWKKLVETSPLYINGKLIYVSANLKLIALDATNGKLIWQKELLHFPSLRGFLVEIDNKDNENLYICIGSKIFKINAKNGKLIKKFGKSGSIDIKTPYSPVIFEENLVVVGRNHVFGFDKLSGKLTFKIPIFTKKKFMGAFPWGGMALDEDRGIVFIPTGNPRPKVYGVKRQGPNNGANSIIAIDIVNKKKIWEFKETFHDLWNLDVAFPPILTTLKFENKKFDVLIAATKVGNIILLERTSGKPIFDINFIKVPRSKIPTEVVSPFQIQISKPEPITKFEWTPKDMNKIKSEFSQKILKNIDDYSFGLFVPPELNKSYIDMAEGPIWEGGAYNFKNQKLFLTVNQTSTILRPHLKSLWPHSKSIKKEYKKELKVYQNLCSSCHGLNRNGKYISGKSAKDKELAINVIPSLVGHHLFKESKKKIMNYDQFKNKHPKSNVSELNLKKINYLFEKWDNDLLMNKKIKVAEITSAFVDDNNNYLTNYPQGEIVSYDMKKGKIEWRSPFGYIGNKNLGTFNRGGLTLTNDGTLFATGTPDKKIYAFDASSGKELWSYDMELSGNAPPTIYEFDGIKYMSVITTGGYNFKFPDRGTILYTFRIN